MQRNEQYAQYLIGMDVKPQRTTRIRKNRFRHTYSRWLFPAMIVLVSLGIIIVGIR